MQEGEVVAVIAGQAQLTKRYMANGGSWGIFRVNGEDETGLFTAKLTTFLKFSEFQGGDRVFLLSSYYYKRLFLIIPNNLINFLSYTNPLFFHHLSSRPAYKKT